MIDSLETPAEQLATQRDIVNAVIEDRLDLRDGEWGGRAWRRIVVNFEANWAADGPVTSVLSFAVARAADKKWEKLSFRLSPASKGLFARLAVEIRAQRGSFWTVCDLVIDADGTYSFTFSYDPPYRLSGTLNDTRFADYIERHSHEF